MTAPTAGGGGEGGGRGGVRAADAGGYGGGKVGVNARRYGPVRMGARAGYVGRLSAVPTGAGGVRRTAESRPYVL